MMKDYRNSDLDAVIPVPASVNVAMADVAATMREDCWLWLSGLIAGDAGVDGRVDNRSVRPEG